MVIMVVIVVMMMIMLCLQAADPGAKGIAMGAIRHVRAWCVCPLSFDVMMMAFLNRADLTFEP
jgi:hypothetical protein